MARTIVLLSALILLNCLKAASQLNLRRESDSTFKSKSIRILPQNFYSKRLGFACKKEIQLQKLTRLPLYIRLGSKDYTDYMERKPNAFKLFIPKAL